MNTLGEENIESVQEKDSPRTSAEVETKIYTLVVVLRIGYNYEDTKESQFYQTISINKIY